MTEERRRKKLMWKEERREMRVLGLDLASGFVWVVDFWVHSEFGFNDFGLLL